LEDYWELGQYYSVFFFGCFFWVSGPARQFFYLLDNHGKHSYSA
jgi:hypothetical protein